jgi:hypothetical protein
MNNRNLRLAKKIIQKNFPIRRLGKVEELKGTVVSWIPQQ